MESRGSTGSKEGEEVERPGPSPRGVKNPGQPWIFEDFFLGKSTMAGWENHGKSSLFRKSPMVYSNEKRMKSIGF